MNNKYFWSHVALFFSGAMFWAAVTHVMLAVKGIETTTLGVRVEADENLWAAAVHAAIAALLFWLYKRKHDRQ